MRILIGLHHVTLGGDTINAVELGSRLRDRGHDVTLFAFTSPVANDDEAPLLRMANAHGISVHTFRRPRGLWARIDLVRQLRDYARSARFDIVHTFGHQDTYYAFIATFGLAAVPLIVNDYNNTLTRALPRRVPLIAGTRDVLDQARKLRSGPAYLIEPPVDVDLNAPGAVDPASFRRKYGIAPSDILLVMVSRLVRTMKSEGLRGAIDAVRLLDDPSVRLILVGDGEARTELAERADKVNAELGRKAVLLIGAVTDPRPAYAAADIVLGMGHSGLRGMAFAKALVIVGERGFCLPLSPDALQHVDGIGVYGVGDGTDIASELAAALLPLVHDGGLRHELGSFGRSVVCDRYSLATATDRLEYAYARTTAQRSWIAWWLDAAYILRCYAPAKARRITRLRRL